MRHAPSTILIASVAITSAAALARAAGVDQVLLFSQHARVSVVKYVGLGATARAVALVELPPAAQIDSVRVRCDTPSMDQPDRGGRVRWRGRIAGRSVKKLRFSFRIVRPKDWLLRQR